MRYPVGSGTKQAFDQDWYIAQGFGNPTSYGFHEGLDINLKTGGDTDLGQEVKAIANGRIVYYHFSSHPTTNFGRHLVYKIDGPWGTRWVHCAHMSDQDFKNSTQGITEGALVGRIGKSGTPYAHLHFSVFKVDPASLPAGIDSIASTTALLNARWEDPLTFIDQWMQAPAPSPVTDQSLYDFQGPVGIVELQRGRSIMREYESTIANLNSKISQIKNIVG